MFGVQVPVQLNENPAFNSTKRASQWKKLSSCKRGIFVAFAGSSAPECWADSKWRKKFAPQRWHLAPVAPSIRVLRKRPAELSYVKFWCSVELRCPAEFRCPAQCREAGCKVATTYYRVPPMLGSGHYKARSTITLQTAPTFAPYFTLYSTGKVWPTR